MPLRHLGYKAVVVNVSDICAMNARATQITVSVAVSNRFPLEALEELFDGIALAAKFYNVDVIGGDTTSSQKGLIISITAIGEANAEDIVYRNGANEGDLLVVTGDLGSAYMGLQILEREKQVFLENSKIQPDLEGNDYILQRQLKPEARTDIKELLKLMDVMPTSMIDISDLVKPASPPPAYPSLPILNRGSKPNNLFSRFFSNIRINFSTKIYFNFITFLFISP
jgi:thiamine-monophosphate kinase